LVEAVVEEVEAVEVDVVMGAILEVVEAVEVDVVKVAVVEVAIVVVAVVVLLPLTLLALALLLSCVSQSRIFLPLPLMVAVDVLLSQRIRIQSLCPQTVPLAQLLSLVLSFSVGLRRTHRHSFEVPLPLVSLLSLVLWLLLE
jgi:hypothetical protein